jgi:hypothetical protein
LHVVALAPLVNVIEKPAPDVVTNGSVAAELFPSAALIITTGVIAWLLANVKYAVVRVLADVAAMLATPELSLPARPVPDVVTLTFSQSEQ